MDKNKIGELKETNYEDAAWTIANLCRLNGNSNSSGIYACAYVLLKATENSNIVFDTLDTYLSTAGEDENRSLFIIENTRNLWNSLRDIRYKFDADVLKAVLLYYEPSGFKMNADQTPVGISRLAIKLMQIKAGDRVADFCTGRGSFLREAFISEPNAEYYGNDVYTQAVEIAKIRSELMEGSFEIVQKDTLEIENSERRFDVVFSNYPFGMRVKDAWGANGNNYMEFVEKYPEFSKAVSLDWFFNKAAYSCISGPRRAVCLMTYGSTWNSLDANARKHFLSKGIVEAVITLPEKVFESTSIGTVMIVLSHGNTSVMMVDARNMCERGRRLNVITDENIEEIYNAFCVEGQYSKSVSCEEIAKNDYIINPIRYMQEDIVVENAVPFETIIRKITRGAQIQASQLDSLVSDEVTDYQYLMLANIQDGMIDEDLPFISEIEPKMEKYCIKNNSLIISKNGAPFKVAIANVAPGKKLLANGNLYVIELDEDKVDPYYIKAFFESDKGAAALRSIVVGAVIPNIGVEQLKKLNVPLVSLEEQREISLKYQALTDEVKILKRKVDKAINSLKHIFDESEEA